VKKLTVDAFDQVEHFSKLMHFTKFKGEVRRFFLFVQSFYRPKTKTCFNRQFSPPAEKRGAPAELVGGDELVGGEQEDTFMRRLDRAAWQESEDHAVEGENVVVEREKPWLGESQEAAERASQEVNNGGMEQLDQSSEPFVEVGDGDHPGNDQEEDRELLSEFRFLCNEGNCEGSYLVKNHDQKNWVAFRTKIVSAGSPSYTVGWGVSEYLLALFN